MWRLLSSFMTSRDHTQSSAPAREKTAPQQNPVTQVAQGSLKQNVPTSAKGPKPLAEEYSFKPLKAPESIEDPFPFRERKNPPGLTVDTASYTKLCLGVKKIFLSHLELKTSTKDSYVSEVAYQIFNLKKIPEKPYQAVLVVVKAACSVLRSKKPQVPRDLFLEELLAKIGSYTEEDYQNFRNKGAMVPKPLDLRTKERFTKIKALSEDFSAMIKERLLT